MWQSIVAVIAILLIVSVVAAVTFTSLGLINRAKRLPVIGAESLSCYYYRYGGNYTYVVVADLVHRGGDASKLLRVAVYAGGRSFDIAFHVEGAAFRPDGTMLDGDGRVESVFVTDVGVDRITVVYMFDNYLLPLRVTCIPAG